MLLSKSRLRLLSRVPLAVSVKKVLELLTELAKKEKEKYATFWKTCGRVLKEGITEDTSNRETLASLLRFASTFSSRETQDVSFEEEVASGVSRCMKETLSKLGSVRKGRF